MTPPTRWILVTTGFGWALLVVGASYIFAGTWHTVALAVEGGPLGMENFANWGLYGVLVWYLWYTTTVTLPRLDRQRRNDEEERAAKHQEEMITREDRFMRHLVEQRESFLTSLDAFANRNHEERQLVRKALSRVAAMERIHAEALVKLSHTMDRNQHDKGDQNAAGN